MSDAQRDRQPVADQHRSAYLEDTLLRVDAYLCKHADNLYGYIRDLVAFPTVNPPGRNCGPAQTWMAEHLQRFGFEVDRWDVYPGDPNVVGRLPGTDGLRHQSILLNGHMDVAVTDSDGWLTDPFTAIRQDGRVYGRGTADMKGALACVLYTLEALHHCGVTLPGDVIVESVIGEEMGEAGTLSCLERGYRADLAIVPEPTGLAIQGQGGVITGWIAIQSPETHHDGQRAAMIHAGGGLHAASAIDKMIKIIEGLHELERHWAVVKSYPGFPPGTNTINPAYIEGGRHPAYIADSCRLWITVHFYPDEHYREIAREVEEHILRLAAADPWLREHPPTFRWGGRSMNEDKGEIFPAAPLPTEHAGVQLLARAHEEIAKVPAEFSMSRTVSDAGWLADAGIPCVLYGPGRLAQAHTVNEFVEEEELMLASRVLARTIVEWCSTPKC